jgi:hypothetical protein
LKVREDGGDVVPKHVDHLRPQRLFQDLDLEGLATQQPLELANALLELAHPGGADDLVVDPDRLAAAFGLSLPLLEQQARRKAVCAATNETDMPGSSVSSTSRIFSATEQRRRRRTEVITSTRCTSSDIAVRQV